MNVVWIHGFPFSSAIFDRQRAIEGVDHIMPDLAGFGEASAPAGDITMDDYAHDVLARAPEKAIFAGLSMGGYICFAIARLAPERVAGLILLDTRETADTEDAKHGRYATSEKVRAEGTRPVVESMLAKVLSSHASPDVVREVRAIMETASPEGVTAALRAMAERPDSSPLLPALDVPVLIIVGEEDSITPPADSERMARLLPNATLARVAGAGHLANVEKADEVNRAVEGWLQQFGN